ncbi:hypothetical protein LOD99_4171 [Oopsacas minuta]|uniref:Uncharacterized protein n=1 Tax=Oopsacas minuta TaxID=111878 RepID=A0AAV7JVN0_9METZ|nr:hypothetical protein LOD99_4171 [Oopsacas minuta]
MHHRSYQSILPTHNKLLQKRWDDTYYDEHRRRVKTASPMVSTTAPKQHPHIVNKLKKQQREQERYLEVQRDNETLMGHMSAIMDKGSGVDHRNKYIHGSLNYGKRVDESQRIEQENKKMLTRIKSRPANYSVSEWLSDRLENERLLSMITTHPPNQQTKSARLYVRDRKEQSQPSLFPLQEENGSLETFDPSVTDTIESLKRELEVAKVKLDKSNIVKADISEVKSFSSPPNLVKLVMEAYAILYGKTGNNLWSQSKKLIAQAPEGIGINNILLPTLKKLKFYIENPNIAPDELKKVSASIVSIWNWIVSVYNYGIIAHKYWIRAEEKGIIRSETLVISPYNAMVDKPSPVKEKTEKTIHPIEISATDTLDSLEKELDVAKAKLAKCNISKYDITTLKSFSRPPALVKLVLEAYAILFGKTGDNLWFQGIKSLTQHNPDAIDIDNMPLPILNKLKCYIENPDTTPEALKKISLCIVSLWNWIECMYNYGILAHKYWIRAKEKGIIRPEKFIIQNDAIPAKPSPVKDKTVKSVYPLEISATDTIESLEKELAVAKAKLGQCDVNKNDITEVKSYSNPPVLVKFVVEAYSVLLGNRGDKLYHQGMKSLAAVLPEVIVNVDNISLPVLERLKFYIEDPNINHQRLKCVSACMCSLWEWIEHVYHYAAIGNKLDQLHTAKYSKDNY